MALAVVCMKGAITWLPQENQTAELKSGGVVCRGMMSPRLSFPLLSKCHYHRLFIIVP